MNRQNTQEVCPFNVSFAEEAAEPGHAARGPGERPVGVEALADGGDSASSDATSTDSAESRGEPVHPGTDGPSLVELLQMPLTEDAWEAFSRGSAIRRAGRPGFARNVCVALGNWLSGEDEPPPEAVGVLVEALSDPAALVRGHAAWALGRVSSAAARSALERSASVEENPWVGSEISSSLEGSRPMRK
ncbi:MAG: hypothetical protein EA351_05515 [Gemmatimonadales bacterium]|nr:MAG: hypothetical protein EA351_05515 [Gemmatimonadales bacterium]